MNRDGFFRRFFSSPIAVAASVAVLVVLLAGWITNLLPWWLVLAILAAVAIGFLAFGLWRNFQARRSESGFMSGVARQADQQAKSGGIDRGAVDDMHRRWLKGFESLRKRVGKGRAIYELPWFVVIGNPATGKTSAIQHSGLQFEDELERGTKGAGGTRNCDWFFANEAVLLDTAGRYSRGGEGTTDREEWLAFLRLLRKYRRDMPINGVVVVVAADELLHPDAHPTDDAKRMRGRLTELIEELQVQFPVYVLVTKCDLAQGFADFFGRQPRERLRELLGWTNPGWEMDDFQKRLEATLEQLRDKVVALRPSMMREEEDPAALRNIYLFPEKLRLLTKNLVDYIDALFRESRFSESAFLRGVYFTSALQTGSTIDDIVKGMGVRVEALDSSKSYFLADFFRERLRQDSQLVVPTGRATVRMRLANNLSLLAVAIACLTVAGLATKAYVENRTTLNQVTAAIDGAVDFPKQSPEVQGQLLNGYWSNVEWLRDKARNPSLVERWGLFRGESALPPVERAFVSSYESAAHRPALERADAALSDVDDPARSIPALQALIAYLVETSRARQSPIGSGGELLAEYWPPGSEAGGKANFAAAYRFYVSDAWRPENEHRPGNEARRQALLAERAEQLRRVQVALPELLKLRTMREWVQDSGAPLALPKQVSSDEPRSAFMPSAWTDRIGPLIKQVDEIRPELDGFSTDAFVRAYVAAYYAHWRQLVTSLAPKADSSDLEALCEEPGDYVEAIGRVQAMVKEPVGGVESPLWVRSLARVTAKQQEYDDAVTQACMKAAAADPCVAWRRWAEEGGSVFDRPRAVVDEMCGADDGDSDAAEVASRCREYLLKPVEAAVEQSRQGCARRLEESFGDGVRRPSSAGEACQMWAEPAGRLWKHCETTLGAFYDCTAIAPRAGTPIEPPSSVATALRRAREFDQLLCGGNPGGGDGGGGGKVYPIRFESLPSSDSGRGVRVTETTLAIRCGGQEMLLAHHNTLVKGNIQWSVACASAELLLTLGTPSGGLADGVELRKDGPLSVLQLLGAAQRRGDEYTWSFPDRGVSASFKVSADPRVWKLASLLRGF